MLTFEELQRLAIVSGADAGNSEPTIKSNRQDTETLRKNYERVVSKCQAECDGVHTRRMSSGMVSRDDADTEKNQCLSACDVDMGVVSPLPQTCEEAVSSWGRRDDLQIPALECKGREPVLINVGPTYGGTGVGVSHLENYTMMPEEKYMAYLSTIREGKMGVLEALTKLMPETNVLCPKTIDRTNGLDRGTGASENGFGYQSNFATLQFEVSHPILKTLTRTRRLGGKETVMRYNNLDKPLNVSRPTPHNVCEGPTECQGLDRDACRSNPAVCNWNDGSWNMDLFIRCWDKTF